MIRKKRIIFVLIIIILVIVPSVYGLGLSGNKLGTIVYEPGKVIRNNYLITGTNLEVEVSVSTSMPGDFVNIEKINNDEYTLVIEFPGELIEEGTYAVSISANEKLKGDEEGITSLLSVSKRFEVEVYSMEKKIGISFTTPNINENDPINFEVDVQSRTYQDIDSIKAEIIVYSNDGEELGRVNTGEKQLKTLTNQKLRATYDSQGMVPGNYLAEAIVAYDGKKKNVTSSFKIGDLDLILKDYTKELNRGFSEFKVTVKNNWGNRIRNVYTKLYIDDQELLQTPSINIDPWEEGQLSGIVNINLDPGNYEGVLKLFFAGQEKEEKISLLVTDKILPEVQLAREEVGKKNNIIVVLSIILVLFLILALFVLVKKYRDGG